MGIGIQSNEENLKVLKLSFIWFWYLIDTIWEEDNVYQGACEHCVVNFWFLSFELCNGPNISFQLIFNSLVAFFIFF